MNKKSKENNPQQKAQSVVDAYSDKQQKKTDPMGSWTGQPKAKNELPVQDADDL